MAVGAWIDRSHWPRHVTVCSNFRCVPEEIDLLIAVLGHVAAISSLPAATVGEEAQSGPDGGTPVPLVESSDLERVHVMLMDALWSAARVESVLPEHNGPGYRPHVTVVDGHRLERGSALRLGTVLLVEIAFGRDRTMAVPVATGEVGQSEDGVPVSGQQIASAPGQSPLAMHGTDNPPEKRLRDLTKLNECEI